MFSVISTISVTCIKNSALINDEKYLIGITTCTYKQNRKSVDATGAITTFS